MSIAVEVSAPGGRPPLGRAAAAALAAGVLRAEGVRDAVLSVTFVSRRAIAALNRRHLRRRGATDVIAFPFRGGSAGMPVVGDVYIAADVARAQAKRYGVPVREECARLVVHGTLHVLGHDHPEGAARTRSAMWKRQEALLRRLARRRA
ncbi:MAG TPA: rRNA maturation RNase YbeY [Gemmatimonadaceae bacterium]|nr:rRNA maturation RNase YbeY [Gemmatimonadaceae bacterium]